VKGDDVRVTEVSRSRDLALEPLNDLLACEPLGQNHLYRDNPLEIEMPRAINHAHPASGNLFEKFVIAEVPGRAMFDIRFLMFDSSQGGAGLAVELRFLLRLVQAAFQQATSAKTLGVLRAQFGPAAGA